MALSNKIRNVLSYQDGTKRTPRKTKPRDNEVAFFIKTNGWIMNSFRFNNLSKPMHEFGIVVVVVASLHMYIIKWNYLLPNGFRLNGC